MGSWDGPYQVDTVYSAATDGFVTATSMDGGDQDCKMQIETPIGVVRQVANPNHDGVQITETSPVKRGDQWRVSYPNTGCGDVAGGLVKIYWIPFDGNLGNWSGKIPSDTINTATTDEFVLATFIQGGDVTCTVSIETPIGTIRQRANANHDGIQVTEMVPVRKGDQWRVTTNKCGAGTTVYRIPFEGVLGAWSAPYNTDTAYTAVTDGFVTATSLEGGDQDCKMQIETPIGVVRQVANPNHDGVQITETSPVKRGDQWRVSYPNTGCGDVAGGLVKIYWIPYTPPAPPTGTIIIKATKDDGTGVKDWDIPAFTANVSMPGSVGDMSLDPPYTFTAAPVGAYTINSVNSATLPPGVTLKNITPSLSQTLSAGGTITYIFNFVTTPPSTGTVQIRATKDDGTGAKDWDSPPFTVNATNSSGSFDISIDAPQDIQGALTGLQRVNAVTPPAGVTLKDVNGNSLPYSQTLTAGGIITFTFNFTTVAALPPPVPTLTVSPSSASVQVGGSQQFTAIYDPDGSGPQSPLYVTNSSGWSSSNNSVATVSSVGVATGASAGSVTITAAYSGLTASASFTVTEPVPTLVVSPSSASVAIGGTKQFTATYDPDGSGPNPSQDVTATAVWSSSDAAKVTVAGGLASRVGHGTALVSASYLGLSDSAVVVDPATLRVSPSSTKLNFGTTVQLAASYDPDGSGSQPAQDVTSSANWSSSKTSVANVDNTSSRGLVTAGSTTTGVAYISAAYQGLVTTGSNRAAITVTAPALTVSCSASPAATATGQQVVWTATASGGTGSYNYRWSGSSPLGTPPFRDGNPVTVTYSTAGTKTGSVRVTSGSQVLSKSCDNSVVISAPLPLSVATLTATPSGINAGDSSMLTWTSTNNAARCDSPDFLTGGLANNTGSDANPDVQVNPSTNTTYSIYCTNAEGIVGPTTSATVTVIPVTTSIKASPTCINGGGNSKISWSATPATLRCDVSGPGLSRTGLTGAQLTGSQIVSVSAKSTYAILCTTNGGSEIEKLTTVDISGCWSEF
jgi:hypothetical protein